jgi:hypothetical protein
MALPSSAYEAGGASKNAANTMADKQRQTAAGFNTPMRFRLSGHLFATGEKIAYNFSAVFFDAFI